MMAILAMAAAAAVSSADQVAAKNSADLQILYEQSCRVRAYGSYDDMCSKLRKRIKEFERDQAREARERRQGGAAQPATAQATVPAATPAAIPIAPQATSAAVAVETPTSQASLVSSSGSGAK